MKEGWKEHWEEIKDDIWKEAMEDAMEELGYSEGEYVKEWSELIEEAKDNFSTYRGREYDDYDPEWD